MCQGIIFSDLAVEKEKVFKISERVGIHLRYLFRLDPDPYKKNKNQ